MASNIYPREHSGPMSEQSMASTMKDKAADAATAVLETAEHAYEKVKGTVEERPALFGILAAAAVGFALGALWQQRAMSSPTDRALNMMRGYAEPRLRALRNVQGFRNSWWH